MPSVWPSWRWLSNTRIAPVVVTFATAKGYDAEDFVNELETMIVRPHVARDTARRSAVDAQTTCHPDYAASQRIRKRNTAAIIFWRRVRLCVERKSHAADE